MRTVYLVLLGALAAAPVSAADCTATSMSELGFPQQDWSPSSYVRSVAHAQAGIDARPVPRDQWGSPAPTGKIGIIFIGMSNFRQIDQSEYRAWSKLPPYKAARRPEVVWVLGAQSGKTAMNWSNPSDSSWVNIATKVSQAGLTAAQIGAISIGMTQRAPDAYGAMTETQLRQIDAIAQATYPNIQQAYFSGINYTGYSNRSGLRDTNRAPEPYVHNDSILLGSIVESGGWATPWVGFWDFWADGVHPNPLTGLFYTCADVEVDGVHPSAAGADKMGYWRIGQWYADPVTRWMWK